MFYIHLNYLSFLSQKDNLKHFQKLYVWLSFISINLILTLSTNYWQAINFPKIHLNYVSYTVNFWTMQNKLTNTKSISNHSIRKWHSNSWKYLKYKCPRIVCLFPCLNVFDIKIWRLNCHLHNVSFIMSKNPRQPADKKLPKVSKTKVNNNTSANDRYFSSLQKLVLALKRNVSRECMHLTIFSFQHCACIKKHLFQETKFYNKIESSDERFERGNIYFSSKTPFFLKTLKFSIQRGSSNYFLFQIKNVHYLADIDPSFEDDSLTATLLSSNKTKEGIAVKHIWIIKQISG